MERKYYVYRTQRRIVRCIGANMTEFSRLLVQDAATYFTCREAAEKAAGNVFPGGKGETFVETKVVEVERNPNGRYSYEMYGRTYYDVKNADDSQDYFYLEVTYDVDLINGVYSLDEMIPLEECRKSCSAMIRKVKKWPGGGWHESVIEIPKSQVLFSDETGKDAKK